jgi:uncharacterized protein (DUF983 family)
MSLHLVDRSALSAIARQLCPRCRAGRIFQSSLLTWFPKMHQRCPACGLKFEREQGYFLGAMYISYGLALITIVLLACALWLGVGLSMEKAVIGAVAIFVPLAPPVTYFARVLWLHLDWAIDPEPQ